MLFRKSSLYVTSSRTFRISKDSSFTKFNLLLGLMVRINIFFIFSVLYKRYILFFFLRVDPQTLFLSANFFIFLLKKIKFYRSFFCNLWISSTIITKYGTNSLYSLIFSETSALNPLFIQNGVLLVVLCSEVLYASILMGNSLT